jgi:hypothetical protein
MPRNQQRGYTTMNEEPILIDVETFCSVKNRMVQLTLQCKEQPKGEIVTGKPVSCTCQYTCQEKEKKIANFPFRCYLHSLQITTKRKFTP